MISLGAVFGGGELTGSPFEQAIRAAGAFFRDKQQGDFGSLNVVFHVPGSLVKSGFLGARTSKWSRKTKMLMIQVAVPEEAKESKQQLKFILNSIREAIEIAKPVFKKAKVEYPAEAYLALVEQGENSLLS